MSGRGGGPVKPVFASPTGLEATAAGSLIEGLVTRWKSFFGFQFEHLDLRHSFPDDVSKAQAAVKKEEHLKRMKSLRKELDYIDKTAWMFDPVEKLIGQNP